MLRPFRTALAALLFCALPALAQAAPALWEVSDADSHIWLFGSIHVLPPDIDWRTPAFDDTLHQAEQVYFEADIGPLGQLALAIKSVQLAMAPHDPWLGKMTPEQMGKLDHSVTPIGLDVGQLLQFEPWLAEAMIEEKVMEKSRVQSFARRRHRAAGRTAEGEEGLFRDGRRADGNARGRPHRCAAQAPDGDGGRHRQAAAGDQGPRVSLAGRQHRFTRQADGRRSLGRCRIRPAHGPRPQHQLGNDDRAIAGAEPQRPDRRRAPAISSAMAVSSTC